MRALLAGIFVFAMLLVAVAIAGSDSKNGDLPPWGIPIILVTFIVSIPVALFVFNLGRRTPKEIQERHISELREKGLLLSETLQAKRVFRVEEFEDEGSHFYIELSDNAVLFLSGQYLYDYPETEDGTPSADPTFPCTEFTILRHKTDHYVVDIICGGTNLPIECAAPHFSKQDFELDRVPEDGQVIRDQSYEEIKKERFAPR